MGCSSSSETDPNLMYGKGHRNIPLPTTNSPQRNSSSKVHPINENYGNTSNGHIVTESSENNTSGKEKKERENRIIKGDLSMYNDAKVQRELKLRERLLKRERLAQEMSDKVMEEKERLSLTSSRSRATSRATSPKLGRRDSMRGVASISEITPSTSYHVTDASQGASTPPSERIAQRDQTTDQNKTSFNDRSNHSTISNNDPSQ